MGRGVLGLAWLLGVAGCSAPREGALKLRERIREANRTFSEAEAPLYRSAEAVRGANWGMTPAELADVRGPPEEVQGDVRVYRETLQGVTVTSAYRFAQGQLAAIRTAWDADQASAQALEAALTASHGPPLSRRSAVETLAARRQAAEAGEVADVLAALAGLAHDAATHRHGGAWLWPSAAAQARAEAAALAARLEPLREASWSTPETAIHLVDPGGRRTVVTWRSRRLAALLSQQETAAAVRGTR